MRNWKVIYKNLVRGRGWRRERFQLVMYKWNYSNASFKQNAYNWFIPTCGISNKGTINTTIILPHNWPFSCSVCCSIHSRRHSWGPWDLPPHRESPPFEHCTATQKHNNCKSTSQHAHDYISVYIIFRGNFCLKQFLNLLCSPKTIFNTTKYHVFEQKGAWGYSYVSFPDPISAL